MSTFVGHICTFLFVFCFFAILFLIKLVDLQIQKGEVHLILRYVPSYPAGGSIDSDCAFEGDYAVPPLSMTEGMQHIRIMEGVSRSLPSSPLLTHQSISVRLQPVKKLTGKND